MEVLLYGCRKSGTTLFQRLLDGTHELFVLPSETKIKNYINLNDKSERSSGFSSLNMEDIYPFCFRAAKKNWDEVNDEVYRNWIENHFKKVASLKDFIHLDIEASMRSMGKNPEEHPNWAIKETSGDTKQIISSFLDAFPNGKVIVIYRDPRHITSAIYREKKRTGTKMGFLRRMSIARHPYGIINKMEAYKNSPRIYRVNYENLVKSTPDVMKGVANFLKISYSDVLNMPTINGKICKVPSSTENKKKVFRNKSPLTNNINLIEYLIIKYYSIVNRRVISKYNKEL